MHYLPHLAKDRKLKKLLDAAQPVKLKKQKNICLYLCASIMSQQLSVKVADIIYGRFLNLYDGNEPTASQILETAPEVLRSIGLSNAKVQYVRNVAAFELENGMGLKKLSRMDNEDIITYLSAIRGVGRWTVEMLLMFALGREDVFAADDLGLQNAMIHVYKLDRSDRKKFKADMLKISSRWSPYRTYACLHLWRWRDNAPGK
ncbi:MAG: DNA-3-methyladenine glycosylase 2 family protein [Chitinophagaceae bacterium]|nr:DNA-3-methyladenine glycosylase 2 family protein [Chitinophagaceae bacterium]MCW5927723.1 DNA-3-methyladenine glycosylase 2 family protein [Chitinophagaceae bacterium]